MNNICFLLCFSVLLLFHTETVKSQESQRSALKKIVIDPGHGGHDPGALGSKTKEKDIVLDIALRLGKKINEKYPDVEVIYTRKTDVSVKHDKRSDIANKAHADLFISIHANSVEKGSRCPSGTETFVMGMTRVAANMEVAKRENSVILLEEDHATRYDFDPNRPESYIIFELMQYLYMDQSINFAAEVQEQFKNSAKRINRGIKQGPIYVLWKTSMPSVLVEVGFICNTEEEKYISSAAGKEQMANSIFRAFSSYKSKIDDRSSFGTGDKPAASGNVEFCIQIFSSSTPKDTNPNNFKKYTDVERFHVSENLFKYIVNRTADYAVAQEQLKKVKTDFNDAFIVSIVNGKIVPAVEGLKLITE